MITPGTYIRLRREAFGLSIDDVAGLVRTEPRWAEIDRRAWIARIEDDVAAISPDVAGALKAIFPLSFRILQQLIHLRSYGADAGREPPLCPHCAGAILLESTNFPRAACLIYRKELPHAA